MSLTIREMLGLSLFIGCIFATMGSFLTIFATGVDDVDLEAAGRVGAIVGTSVAVVIFTYGSVSKILGVEKAIPVDRTIRIETIRSMFHSIDMMAVENNLKWSVSRKIMDSSGTPTIDLHDMDIRGADAIVAVLLKNRNSLGRIRIVTGTGRGSAAGGVDLTVAEHVISKLRRSASSHGWQFIEKRSHILLRPMGRKPTRAVWLRRFLVGVVPITGSLALAFRDLAGSAPGAGQNGFLFGFAIGLMVTAMMASHRDRTG
ncbi:MAG TPA: hypothetical protein HA330_03895 [Candidatus Thalassarchaeaceae archaeon]|nr:MAG TPA: hypothetical protein D7H85_03895 [Candidatus Poseidoniales archaeon]HII49012.1 hypothetical protein [Candidatus Thalassarchaeaceae archaeon]